MSTIVRSTSDPVEFQDAVFPFLAKDPVLNTALLGVIENRVQGTDPSQDSPLFISLYSGDQVVGAVASAAPRGLVLGALRDDLVPPLVSALVDLGIGVERVVGTSTAAPLFARSYAKRVGKTVQAGRSDRLHRLVTFASQSAAGTPRLATLADLSMVRSFVDRFRAEIGDGPERGDSEAWAVARIELKRIWLWEFEGDVVCLVGRQATVAGAARVGPVYTPPEFRGHGYASALTAHVTQQILADGATACLFTDIANPTSNKIYAAIGYRPVVDFVGFGFS